MHVRRLLVGIVLTVLLLPASPASADPPIQEWVSDPVSIVLPGSDFCGFDVQADALQKFKIITFTGERGTAITAQTVGGIRVRLTNLETDESTFVSIPGPGFIDATGSLVVGTGPWLVFLPGQLLYVVGRIEFVTGPFGVEPHVVRGRSLDLCDVLAP
jgi:hypothetical protein